MVCDSGSELDLVGAAEDGLCMLGLACNSVDEVTCRSSDAVFDFSRGDSLGVVTIIVLISTLDDTVGN